MKGYDDMAKRLDISKLINLDEITKKLERNNFHLLAIGDRYHDDDEIVNDMPVFTQDANGKTKRDDTQPPQYFYVNATMESVEKEFNMVDVQLRAIDPNVFNGLNEDDVCSIVIDKERTKLSVDTSRNLRPVVTLEVYVTEVKGVE